MTPDEVLTVLVNERRRALVGYAYLLCGSLAEAEELVQESLVRTYVRLGRGTDVHDAEPYVRRSILRLYVDGFRRRRRWLDVRHLVATEDRGADLELTAGHLDVRGALTTLPRRERACVVLRYYSDLTVRQIAEQLNISEGAVKRYLSQGVRRLEGVLGPDADAAEDDAGVLDPDRPLAGEGLVNELSRHLEELADAAGRAAGDAPAGEVLAQARRRRVVRRTVPAVAGVAVVAAAALLAPTAVQRWRDGVPPASGSACGHPVATAAGEAFDGAGVLGTDGPVAVSAGANATVESGDGLAVGVGVSYAASGVDAYELVPSDGSYAVLWLVDDDGLVVGVAVPDVAGEPETTTVTPDRDVWVDGSYELVACDGEAVAGAVPTGEYELVAAVAARPGAGDDGVTSVVLSPPVDLRVGPADALENLGACGSAWPADVETTTDGYELGLRVTGPADLGEAVAFDPDSDPPGEGLEFPITVRNDSGRELVGWTGHPWLVVVRDGVVVGVPGGSDDVGIEATMDPRGELVIGAWMPLHDCVTMGQDPETGLGEPLPSGDYEVYAIAQFFFTEPAGTEGPEGDRTDVTAVGGPWLMTIP